MDSRLLEEQGDLFAYELSHSLAHCVSVDLRMGKGIAVHFRNRYGRVEELKSQNPKIGDVLTLPTTPGNYAFYLITKLRYNQKPTYDSLQRTLTRLRIECERLGVRRLAIPRIGCGLDGLDWTQVRAMILATFASAQVEIVVRYI